MIGLAGISPLLAHQRYEIIIPTDLLTTLQLQNLSIDDPELRKICRAPNFDSESMKGPVGISSFWQWRGKQLKF